MSSSFSAITRAKGFFAAGISCGIKKSNKKDLALILSVNKALATGLFTANSVKAAPLLVTRDHLKNGRAQAILINSGNANCFTGVGGLADARKVVRLVAKCLTIKTADVLTASTGIIAKPLPLNKIIPSIPSLCLKLRRGGGQDAAYAIQTTDTFLKQAAKSFKIGAKTVSIGAMAKGAGMVFPHLRGHATTLCFITTDADIQYRALKEALGFAVEESFNAITIDGCMSTNDMVLILANAAANNRKIKLGSREFYKFRDILSGICKELAKKVVADAEGASKFIEIRIKGAKTQIQAKQAAFAIANSALFKSACFGENKNIGRIVQSVGAIGIKLEERKTKISLSNLRSKNIIVGVDLGQGKFDSVVYTSDLTPAYVKINAGYN
ncbi:MAG: bifunctional glutamate N-acetyltransferase/amino-acid acetyltransferase ArgJ [Candidatus Omnitrophica bacterium]|nr:bifunctional glutamate N-acetyltransferase/amino-acid acetyltransferase ArgJ [Candidatus Omnitrophota bacterium]